MPIFDYKCNNCGRIFEQIVKVNTEQTACPDCQSKQTTRLLSGFSVGRVSCAAEESCEHRHQCGGGCGCNKH